MQFKKFTAILIAFILLIAQFSTMYAATEPVPLENGSDPLLYTVFSSVGIDGNDEVYIGSPIGTAFVGDIVALSVHVEYIPEISSIHIPLWFDTTRFRLLNTNTLQPFVVGMPVAQGMIQNEYTNLILFQNQSLIGGLPRFDLVNGFLSISWINPNVSTMNNGDKIVTFIFEILQEAPDNFNLLYGIAAQTQPVPGTNIYESFSPGGITIHGTYDDRGNFPRVPFDVDLDTLTIARDITPAPEYVIVHSNLDGTATVIVTGVVPGATVILYDADGNTIGVPATANEDGYAIFQVPANDIPPNNRFYATATDPPRTESVKTGGEPDEFYTEWIIVSLVDPTPPIPVLFGTPEDEITFPTQIEGQIGMLVRNRVTGAEIGVFIPDELPSAIDFDGYFDVATPPGWVSADFDPEEPGTYNFIGTPVLPNGVTNPRNLTATQQVIVLPEGVGNNYHAVIFINNGEIFGDIQIVHTGYTATEPTPPADRDGYTFTGWHIRVTDGTLEEFDFDTPITELTILFAGWIADEEFIVTFNRGTNGTMNPATPDPVTVSRGESVSLTLIPTISANNNYTFLGWSADGGNTVLSRTAVSELPIIADTDFVAQYQRTTTNITGGGGGTPMSTITINCVDEENRIIFTQTIDRVAIGSQQTVNAPDLEGFILDDARTRTITIVSNATQNVVTFRYITDNGAQVPPPLERYHHFRYLFGFEDGTIRPDAQITREEVATIFFRLLRADARMQFRTNWHSFPDVESWRWSNQQIATMANAGILQGDWYYGTFRPGESITRAEFATIAMRFDNMGLNYSHNFDDVVGHWAERHIAAAANRGWILGYPDGTFRPDQHITRAEAATLINRVLERVLDSHGFLNWMGIDWPDLTRYHWAFYAMQEATVSNEFERRYPNSSLKNWTRPGEDFDFGEVLFLNY